MPTPTIGLEDKLKIHIEELSVAMAHDIRFVLADVQRQFQAHVLDFRNQLVDHQKLLDQHKGTIDKLALPLWQVSNQGRSHEVRLVEPCMSRNPPELWPESTSASTDIKQCSSKDPVSVAQLELVLAHHQRLLEEQLIISRQLLQQPKLSCPLPTTSPRAAVPSLEPSASLAAAAATSAAADETDLDLKVPSKDSSHERHQNWKYMVGQQSGARVRNFEQGAADTMGQSGSRVRKSYRYPEQGAGDTMLHASSMRTQDPGLSDEKKTTLISASRMTMLNFKSQLEDQTPLEEEEYDVSDYYSEDGWAQQVARSGWFANLSFTFITINAIYIGFEIDNNNAKAPQDADWSFQVSDHSFCAFFSFELLVRFLAFQNKRDCLKDSWFVFDLCLVILMVLETWVMQFFLVVFNIGSSIPSGPLRLLRLMRLARMTRLLRALPELVTLIKGFKVATRAVASSLLLILILVYVFSIFILLGLRDDERFEERFGTLGLCMWTLLLESIYMEDLQLLVDLKDGGLYHMVLCFATFVLLAQMTVINMTIGVLCEVVSAVAQTEKDEIAVKALKQVVLSLLMEMDEDGSGMIEQHEVKEVLENQYALEVLDGLNVDVVRMFEWFEMKFEESSSLDIRRVMQAILTQRGDRPLTMTDLVDAHNFSRWTTGKMEERIKTDFALQLEKLHRSVAELPQPT